MPKNTPPEKQGARIYKAKPTPTPPGAAPAQPTSGGAPAQARGTAEPSAPAARDASPASNGGGAAPSGAPAGQGTPATPYRAQGAAPGRYPHRTANAAGASGFGKIKNFFVGQKKLSILISSLCLVLVVLVVVVLALPGAGRAPSSSLPAASTSHPVSASAAPPESYDKNANSLPTTQFVGTILPEGEDAGDDYVADTLFLGDSNTARMLGYSDVTGVTLANGIGIESMGIQSFTTLKCVRFQGMAAPVSMAEAVAIMQPRRVVITFGTNNCGMGTDTFIDYYRFALEAIENAYPHTDIIIGAVPPLDRIHQHTQLSMTAIDQFNLALVELAEEMDLKFLNWSEALKDPATGFCQDAYTLSDGIHLTKEGMEALFGYFRTHSYASEDRRPKPLNPIPARNGSMHDMLTSGATGSSSSAVKSATVTFSAGEGGTLQAGGSTGGSFSYKLAVGETSPSVTAVPKEGYVFVAWSVSLGSIPSTTSATLSGFTMPTGVDPDVGVSIVASFAPDASTSVSTSKSKSEEPDSQPPSEAESSSQAESNAQSQSQPASEAPVSSSTPPDSSSSQQPVSSSETPVSSSETPVSSSETPISSEESIPSVAPDPDPEPKPEPGDAEADPDGETGADPGADTP